MFCIVKLLIFQIKGLKIGRFYILSDSTYDIATFS